jgi:predicted nucleotidyltransferase component of viral defense system
MGDHHKHKSGAGRMIPISQITQWRSIAPWPDDMQVEQDLILSRVLVEIFSDPYLNKELAFRGGTALHKLFISPPARYSEDIDLVRTSNGPIKPLIDALRTRLEPWLDKPQTTQTKQSFKLLFYFNPESSQASKQRIKIEINIKETFSIVDRLQKDFSVNSDWFSGNATINTFQLEELLGTKMRALYQRSKGRDVFDLWLALNQTNFDISKTIQIFSEYMNRGGTMVTREIFEKNLDLKLREHAFLDDIGPLLSPEFAQSHSSLLVTENGDSIVTSNGDRIVTEGWNLTNAAEEVKNVILIHLT